MHSILSRFGWRHLAASLMVVFLSVLVHVAAQDTDNKPVGDPYPLEKCVIMDVPLDKRAHVLELNGREIRVCCSDCEDTFRAKFETWVRTLDDRIKDQQRSLYPLDICVVDETKLEDSNRLDVVVCNRLFRVCSAGCQERLDRDPAKYFAIVNKAVIEKQKESYPLTKCIVSGKALGSDAVDHVVANQLVRLANADQIDAFNKTPGKYLAQVREAAKKKKAK